MKEKIRGSEFMKKTLTALVLLLLVVPMISTPVYAAKPLPAPPYWFECTAGYKVYLPSIPIFDVSDLLKPKMVGFLGIDAYHVHASSVGPNYDLLIYYIFKLTGDIEPIEFFVSKDIGLPLFTYNPDLDFSVSRKGLTVTASDLPPINLQPQYVAYGELPEEVQVTANPSLSRPERIPPEYQDIPLGPITVTFDGTWCAAHTETALQYFVFNVRVTITPTVV